MAAPTNDSLIEREISELNDRLLKFEKKGKLRRTTAYILKFCAAAGGLAITFNIAPSANQFLGGVVAGCVFLDGWVANSERLVGEIRAGYAARSQRDKIARDYNRSLTPILQRLQANAVGTDEQKLAVADKDELQMETHRKLQEAVATVEKALAETDLKVLKSMSNKKIATK